jgi:hypothetical protein
MYEQHHNINPIEAVQEMFGITVDISIYAVENGSGEIISEVFSAYFGEAQATEIVLKLAEEIGIIKP